MICVCVIIDPRIIIHHHVFMSDYSLLYHLTMAQGTIPFQNDSQDCFEHFRSFHVIIASSLVITVRHIFFRTECQISTISTTFVFAMRINFAMKRHVRPRPYSWTKWTVSWYHGSLIQGGSFLTCFHFHIQCRCFKIFVNMIFWTIFLVGRATLAKPLQPLFPPPYLNPEPS